MLNNSKRYTLTAKRLKVINVVGARPNFMKIAPLMHEFKKHQSIDALLVHTGQHYDDNMSKLFFEDLEIPEPDVYLEVGSGTHAHQTSEIMKRFEPLLLKEKPDLVIVVGDVNSTIACALCAVKLGIKVAHVEAGLRSFDKSMPEEINRILTDSISDYLFTTETSAEKNLLKEGIDKSKIYFVGNVMIDTLEKSKAKSQKSKILEKLGLKPKGYALLTLHRPSNVDNRDNLLNIFEALGVISKHIRIVFSVHPRTKNSLESFNIIPDTRHPIPDTRYNNILFIDPLGYLDFMKLTMESRLVLTDSGGMQEETTVLDVPCVTLRNNTERPITVEQGTNTVVGTDKKRIIKEALNKLNAESNGRLMPELWDGRAAQRIVNILVDDMYRVACGL